MLRRHFSGGELRYSRNVLGGPHPRVFLIRACHRAVPVPRVPLLADIVAKVGDCDGVGLTLLSGSQLSLSSARPRGQRL